MRSGPGAGNETLLPEEAEQEEMTKCLAMTTNAWIAKSPSLWSVP